MPIAEQKGGAEVMLAHLIEHASDSVEWVTAFLEDGPMAREFESIGVETHVIPTGRLRNIPAYARTVRRIASIARTTDAVFGWMRIAQIYSGPAAWLAERPGLWYQLGLPADVSWVDRLATLLPSVGIITCSEAGARQQNALWPNRPTHVVHPGIDLDRFDPRRVSPKADLRHKFGLPRNAPVVGIVGRLQHWKGIHVFIDAIKRVRQTYPDVRGIIVGGKHNLEPDYPNRLRRQIREAGLEKSIIMVGFQRDVEEWMKVFDVFVHASDREPFGIVVIEAMAAGLPVVASDTAGPTEVISDGVSGLFAPFGNSAKLANQITRYLNNPDFAATVGDAARSRAQHFTASHFAERLTCTVQKVLSGPDNVYDAAVQDAC